MNNRAYMALWHFVAAMACLVVVFGFPHGVKAVTGLTIQPVKIDEEISPGNSLVGKILLTNASDGPVNVDMSLQDFVPVTGADTYQFVGRAPGISSVRDWITVNVPTTFTLKYNEQIEIPYTITAPENAEPGGHFGGIKFKATPVATSSGSLKVGTEVAMLILIKIPGAHLEKGKILDFFAPLFTIRNEVPFTIKFENEGTVHFEPRGEIAITNMFGGRAGGVPINGQPLLPGSIKEQHYNWITNFFSIGLYTAQATVYANDNTPIMTKTIHFWVLPIWYMVGFVLTVIVFYVLFRLFKKHVRISVVK